MLKCFFYKNLLFEISLISADTFFKRLTNSEVTHCMASFLSNIGLKLQKTIAMYALGVKNWVVHEFLYICKAHNKSI